MGVGTLGTGGALGGVVTLLVGTGVFTPAPEPPRVEPLNEEGGLLEPWGELSAECRWFNGSVVFQSDYAPLGLVRLPSAPLQERRGARLLAAKATPPASSRRRGQPAGGLFVDHTAEGARLAPLPEGGRRAGAIRAAAPRTAAGGCTLRRAGAGRVPHGVVARARVRLL